MSIQYIIVAAILVVAVAYVAWRIYRMLKAAASLPPGCVGCTLATVCEKKNSRKDTKKRCKEKK